LLLLGFASGSLPTDGHALSAFMRICGLTPTKVSP